MSELNATPQHYEEFVKTVMWQDLKAYCLECIEFNRDYLDRTTEQPEDSKESDEMLRGRNRGLRDLVSYVEKMAEGDVI